MDLNILNFIYTYLDTENRNFTISTFKFKLQPQKLLRLHSSFEVLNTSQSLSFSLPLSLSFSPHPLPYLAHCLFRIINNYKVLGSAPSSALHRAKQLRSELDLFHWAWSHLECT